MLLMAAISTLFIYFNIFCIMLLLCFVTWMGTYLIWFDLINIILIASSFTIIFVFVSALSIAKGQINVLIRILKDRMWQLLHSEICQLFPLTWSIIGGEVKAGDFSASKPQHTDQLTLVGDARLQPWDGVGVQVAGDQHLSPWVISVFLKKW